MLLGREALLEQLTSTVARAVVGQGSVTWLVGDAGVGKTSLLRGLVDQIGPEARALCVSGHEGEVDLAWAGLEQLVGPLIAEGLDASLPAPQRAALRAALALEGGDGSGDESPLAPVVGARTLLAAAAEAQALVLVVDDVQWLDQPSRRAVDHLATRLDGCRMALVVAGRPHHDVPSPVVPQRLEPLDPAAAAAVLRQRGVTDPAVAQRVIAQLGGNPLLLEAATEAMDGHQRAGRRALPEVLVLPSSVARLAEQRLAGLDDEVRTAVLVAAVAPRSDLGVVGRALDGLGEHARWLEAAEAAGIIDVHEGVVRFAHPTLRSAAYHGMSTVRRRQAHLAVAGALTDIVAKAWHAGLGTFSPDEDVAGALTGSGAELLHRRTPVDAAQHFELAAVLSPEPEVAAVRLRLAAQALAETGRSDAALVLLERADRQGQDQLEAARREQLRLRMASREGAADEVIERLRALAAEVEESDPELSAELLLDTLPALVRSIRLGEIEAAASSALDYARRAGSDRLARRAEVVLGAVRLAGGDLAGSALLDRHVEVLADEGALAAGPFLAEVVAPSLGLLHRGPEVDVLFDTLEADLRAAVAVPALIVVLGARAVLAHGRDLRETLALNAEAMALADAVGQPELAAHAAGSQVIAAAVRGDRDACLDAARRCAASPHEAHQLAGFCGLGALHLGYGELTEALTAYDELYDRFGVGSFVIRWEPEWCEALVRARRREDAVAVLEKLVQAPGAVMVTAGIERVRGLLADDDEEAAEHLTVALAVLDFVPNDVARGRTELLWGERLRRSRKRAAARAHLEEAVMLLDRVGAEVWAERARRELVATGAGPNGTAGSVLALTVQELDAARLAVAGATNAEIGERMFLSPRTVETHLGKVYRKLGVRNRLGLVAWAAEAPDRLG